MSTGSAGSGLEIRAAPTVVKRLHDDIIRLYEGTYIWFVYAGTSRSRKTHLWRVLTEDRTFQLGLIKWLARWRKYAFFPNEETVYEEKCMRELADFCEARTREHKEKKDA